MTQTIDIIDEIPWVGTQRPEELATPFKGEKLRKWNLKLRRDLTCPLIQVFGGAPLSWNFRGLHRSYGSSHYMRPGTFIHIEINALPQRIPNNCIDGCMFRSESVQYVDLVCGFHFHVHAVASIRGNPWKYLRKNSDLHSSLSMRGMIYDCSNFDNINSAGTST